MKKQYDTSIIDKELRAERAQAIYDGATLLGGYLFAYIFIATFSCGMAWAIVMWLSEPSLCSGY